ncbi:MAG: alpha/beta-hydrolase family protein, partial [Pseudomonadota bacterium]
MIRASLSRIVGPFSVPCFLVGLVFFAASLTPSLIPRGPEMQGVLGGLVTALGYLAGQIVALLWRALDLPEFQGRAARIVAGIAFAVVAVFFIWVLGSSLTWQNALREKMGMEPAEALGLAQIVLIAVAVFVPAYLVGRLLASFFRLVRAWFYRIMPPRRANVLGVLTVVLIVLLVMRDEVFARVIVGLDESYEAAQALFDQAPPPPEDPRKSGSSASLIAWGGMGAPGRDFVTTGPSGEAISAFSGRAALEPIRVYVGRANGETPQERAELALAEMLRLGAFDREVLIIASPTGTGWMDPGAYDPLEYMHNGDVATVAVQYSYLQSPFALILETNTGLDQAVALQEVVHGFWKELPEEDRPRLYVQGLSLGAWSSMYATNLFRLLDDPINGAFWAGPPFPSAFWNYVQGQRNPGSPWVLPEIGDGSVVRYASHTEDASRASA